MLRIRAELLVKTEPARVTALAKYRRQCRRVYTSLGKCVVARAMCALMRIEGYVVACQRPLLEGMYELLKCPAEP
jgi:hypothetical protein